VTQRANGKLSGRFRALVTGVLPPLAILLVWHLAARSSQATIPRISDVVDVLTHPFRDPPGLDSYSLAHSALISLLRVLCGFSLAALTAIPLAMLVGRIRFFRELLTPTIELIRPVCPVAWLPVLIILFGLSSVGSLLYGQEAWRHGILDHLGLAMVAVTWYGAFFPIFVNTVHGVTHVKQLFVEVALTNGATRAQIFRHIVLPAALPAIVAGLRIGMGTAWMVIVAAEFFPGTKSGLGYMITTSHEVAEPHYGFAAIVVIGTMGIVINALLGLVERRAGRWQARER
jgi:NitT/TauT family transport system permease protein